MASTPLVGMLLSDSHNLNIEVVGDGSVVVKPESSDGAHKSTRPLQDFPAPSPSSTAIR